MGFTVKDLADSANISKSYLDYIESGNREPSPEKLKAIALTLNIDVEKLLEIQAEDSLNKAKNTQLSNRERMERVRNIENMLTLGMRNYLENDGWDVSDLPRSGFGDIKGEKDNTVWLVEAKIIINDSRISMNSIYGAIGQLVTSIESFDNNYKYSIISNSQNYLEKLAEVFPRFIADSIDLTFFVIKDNLDVLPINVFS